MAPSQPDRPTILNGIAIDRKPVKDVSYSIIPLHGFLEKKLERFCEKMYDFEIEWWHDCGTVSLNYRESIQEGNN